MKSISCEGSPMGTTWKIGSKPSAICAEHAAARPPLNGCRAPPIFVEIGRELILPGTVSETYMKIQLREARDRNGALHNRDCAAVGIISAGRSARGRHPR